MDAAVPFGSANVLFINEDYEGALKHYACAITLQDCAEYRTCRAATYLKVGKFEEVLQDAEQALKFDPSSHMAMYWRGIALFYMGDFAAAKAALEASLRASPTAKAPRQLWIRKCDAELSGSTLPLGAVAAEATKAAPMASTSAAASAGPSAPAAPAKAVEPVAAVSADSAEPAKSTISGRKPIKREWYQSDSAVFVTIFAKGVDQERLKVDFKERDLSVSFPIPGSADEEYQLDAELYETIDPAASKVEVSKVKVELVLAKKAVGVQWKDLEKVEELPFKPEQPAYPTSNVAKKNWSQIDREIDQELKAEKPEGDEALNSLFKQIYERADDETRRAMNKSFQTSGGTVLSTNWNEVARSDYEGKDRPTPPEGQEWRDWRKKDG